MAKKYRGIEAQKDSIRICFSFMGRRRETINNLPTATNLKAASLLRTEIRRRIKRGVFTLDHYKEYFPGSKWLRRTTAKTPKDSFHGTLERWFALVRPTLRGTTITSYTQILNRIKATFPDYPTTPEIRSWISEMQDNDLTLKTIRNRLTPLREGLDLAVEEGNIEYNPASKIKRLKKSLQEEIRDSLKEDEIDPFDIDELEILLKNARDFLSFSQMHNMISFWVFSGLRPGEVFALAYEVIDFNKGTAKIMMRVSSAEYAPPKTVAGRRTLDLLPEALTAIKNQKEHTFMRDKAPCGKFGEYTPIFRNAIGEPFLHSQNFWRYWRQLLRKSGLRYRHPYQLRHTFASMAIASGESEEWVAKYLGHTDIAMVRRHYKSYLKEAQKRAGREGGKSIRALIKEMAHG